MDIGLYNLKYPARKAIAGVLPRLCNVNPNTISWCILPVGIAMAGVYYFAARGYAWLYLVGILLIILRMFLATLDGLVAVHYQKSTPWGELVNRLPPEICDVLYLGALAIALPHWVGLVPAVFALGWLTTFSGLLGAVVGQPTVSVGPVGQTDRLAALLFFSIGALVSDSLGWGIDFMRLFLLWAVIGGLITVSLRIQRQYRAVVKRPARREGA